MRHQADQQRRAQKERCDLVNVPAEQSDAQDQADHGQGKDNQNQSVAFGHGRRLRLLFLQMTAGAPVFVDPVHRAALRIPANAAGVESHKTNGNGGDDQPHHKTVAEAGKGRQFGNALSDTHGKGIQEGAGKAGPGAHKRQGNTHNGIVSQRNGQRHEQQNKRDYFFAHPEHRAEHGKNGNGNRNKQDTHQARPGVQPADFVDQRL